MLQFAIGYLILAGLAAVVVYSAVVVGGEGRE